MPRAALPSLAAGAPVTSLHTSVPITSQTIARSRAPASRSGGGCGLARTPPPTPPAAKALGPPRAGGPRRPLHGSPHRCSVRRPCARPARRRSPVGLCASQPRGLSSRRRRSAPRGPGPPKAGRHGRGEPGSQRRGPEEATLGSRGAWRAAAGSLTTVRRGSAPGVRDRARRSLRALPERVPAELSEPLSSEITMKSSMATGPAEPRASGQQQPWRPRLGVQLLKRLQRPRRRHPG